MNTGRIRLSVAIGLAAVALMGAVGLSVTSANAQGVNTPPGGSRVELTNTGIAPTQTDLSTLIIGGYESPETSTVAAKPASAP